MKYPRISLVTLVALAMTWWAISITANSFAAGLQGQSTALERGYRTGYSDGYNAGYRDVSDQAVRSHQDKGEYQSADRNYNEAWGPVEDYRDGYQQGFEAGYAAGYDRRPFDSSLPTGLSRRGTVNSRPAAAPDNSQDTLGASAPIPNSPLYIQRDTILTVELQQSLSTDASQQGDRFQARVIEPRELEGAIIEGRVTRVKRAGKLKGTSELQLSFETIRMPDNRVSSMSAQVVEVVDMGQRDGVGGVDPEGGVKGRDSTKDDVSKVGATTGIGAIIGAIAGGGKGAAIGAAIGGSIGTAGVLSTRGKDLRLEPGQQLRIRAANEIRIQ